jgi:predicted enzyme related to lactoylglutathione lyase
MRAIIDIDVPDLERGIAFYRDAVGLKLTRVMDGDIAELAGASCMIYLLAKPEGSRASKSGAQERRYTDRHWTPVHVDFVVDDIDEAVARALRAGAVRESDCIEWRGSQCITFSDPFGHGFCLIAFDAETYSDED